MSEWDEISKMTREWKEKNSKLDKKFVKCIYRVCIWWYKMTDSEKKFNTTLLILILVLLAMLIFYDLGYAFGKFLYHIRVCV